MNTFEVSITRKNFDAKSMTHKNLYIHCHLDSPDYEADKEAVLARMKEREVGAITIGTDFESSKKAVMIASKNNNKNENVWACIGVHPNKGEFSEIKFEDLMRENREKVVAIGECGLDFFKIDMTNLEEEKNSQKANFEKQINFALKHDRPLMLHCREAYGDVLDILEIYKKQAGEKLRGNCHFFAGNITEAKRFLDLGFTLSFTGVITFTHDYDEVIKFIPIDSIMSETDAPYVAPVPHRGKRNEPVFVIEVVKKIAEIRGENEEKVREAMLGNAKRVFNLPN